MFVRIAAPLDVRCLFIVVTLTLCCFRAATTEAGNPNEVDAVDFDRDVRAIFSEHCFKCHGPDEGKRQAGLRLDRQESALGVADSGTRPIVAGMPEESELIRRITSHDPDELMPPAAEEKPLTAEQVQILTRWVQQGAPWANHWSFATIRSPELPRTELAAGKVENPIDLFVLRKLKATGWSQAERESKERLIRRVSLDLTGLPPSIQQIDDFVHDDAANAFETVVDRLLSSEHFGERLALPWLDLARYGDTSGYHNDSLRDMWLWREWVVNAFNRNMPFDQFTVEQLAGDLIPNASIQQQVASGFHRNVMTSDEGGLIDAEYRNLYVVDRVATTGVTWLGMTVACAQCHDHKYDPITQQDFYQLYAFFNNVPENGKDGVRDRNPKPFLRVPSATQATELEKKASQLAAEESQLNALRTGLAERQTAWEAEFLAKGAMAKAPQPAVEFPLDENGDGLVDCEDNSDASASAHPILNGELHGEARFEQGVSGQSFDSAGKHWYEYGNEFNFERDEPFSVAAYLYVTKRGGSPFGKMDDKNGARGWDIEFHGLRPSVHLIHRWSEDAIHVQADEDFQAKTFTHLAVTYDGSGKAAGIKLYVNGLLAKSSIRQDSLKGSIQSETPFSIGRRGSSSTQFSGRIDDLRLYRRELTPAEVASFSGATLHDLLAIPKEQRTKEQASQLETVFSQTEVPELAALQQAVADLRKAKDDYETALPNTMIMSEMDQPRDTFIKVRGNYDRDGEKVTAAVPSFLPQIAAKFPAEPLNRLDLAHWLVAPENPLTARVTVNRWWAMLFGTGLVKTQNDFGSQGERPSHPQLLDWLAADLMRDWDTKRVIKQMVLSATYQQACQVAPEVLVRDQENRLLARGPRQRLDAELLRDNALSIAGILNPAIGGKSIKPSQPEGTWEINEMSGYSYEKSKGADLYRRGLYVYWRRSTVYPSFVTLDAPTREFCVSQRAKTSTPLQSLVLMNDPVFVEAARAFAERVLSEPELDQPSRLSLAWRLALARAPTATELSILSHTLEQQLNHYRENKEAAEKLSTVGDLPKADGLDTSELAAWTALGNVILNLNETISN